MLLFTLYKVRDLSALVFCLSELALSSKNVVSINVLLTQKLAFGKYCQISIAKRSKTQRFPNRDGEKSRQLFYEFGIGSKCCIQISLEH